MVASIPSESVLVLNLESGGRPQQRAFTLFTHRHVPLAAGSRQSPTLDQIQFMSIFLLWNCNKDWQKYFQYTVTSDLFYFALICNNSSNSPIGFDNLQILYTPNKTRVICRKMLISQFDWNGFRINCLKQLNFDIKSEVSQKNLKTRKS